MGVTRRLLLLLVIGLILSISGSLWATRGAGVAAEEDNPLLEHPPEATTTTTTAPTTTTTVAPVPTTVAAAAAAPRAPVRPPKNPYQPEAVVELGTIEIPKINLVHQIYEGISLRTIDRGPGHWPGTALPGQVGNAVFAGHRVTHSHPFRNIDQLSPGDEVFFNIGGARHRYVVTGSEVVTPKALHITDQGPTPTATLFACHPPGSARFRYVVRLALQA